MLCVCKTTTELGEQSRDRPLYAKERAQALIKYQQAQMAGGGSCEEKRGSEKISQRVYGERVEDSEIEEGDKCLCVEIEGGTLLRIAGQCYESEHVKK